VYSLSICRWHILIAAAESGFINQLVHKLANTVPSVNPALVTATGATELHQVFAGAELDGVLRTYAWGIKVSFAITIVACGVTVPISLCSKWNNINAKKPVIAVLETSCSDDYANRGIAVFSLWKLSILYDRIA
jgi:hypothetical protein